MLKLEEIVIIKLVFSGSQTLSVFFIVIEYLKLFTYEREKHKNAAQTDHINSF